MANGLFRNASFRWRIVTISHSSALLSFQVHGAPVSEYGERHEQWGIPIVYSEYRAHEGLEGYAIHPYR